MVLEAAAPSRPVLTLAQAVEASDVSRSTLRRWLQAGRVPGAQRSDDGGWAIPVDGLLAAGARLHSPQGGDPGVTNGVEGLHDAPSVAHVDTLVERLAELRFELAMARMERDKAEAVAEERGRALEDARRMLRMLEAGPIPVHEPPVVPAHDTPLDSTGDAVTEAAKPARRWWGRRRT